MSKKLLAFARLRPQISDPTCSHFPPDVNRANCGSPHKESKGHCSKTPLGSPETRVQGPISEDPIWTHVKQLESLSWSVPGSSAWLLVLQIRSSPFSTVFWSKPIDFPSKTGAILASICHFLVLDPHLKSLGPITLLQFICLWTLDPRLKLPLVSQHVFHYLFIVRTYIPLYQCFLFLSFFNFVVCKLCQMFPFFENFFSTSHY